MGATERSDPDETEERLVILETKVGYQDQTIEELNEVVTKQQDQIDRLLAELRSVRQALESLEPGGIESGEEDPPPHY